MIRSSQHRLKEKRIPLWTKLLEVDERTYEADYRAHKALAEQDLNKSLIENIRVDIDRSFKSMKQEISSQNLVNLLHAYAVEDPSIPYCQGMNFMAGFLYI